MPTIEVPQILATCSGVLGVVSLITSSLLLDYYREYYQKCHEVRDMVFWRIAGRIGAPMPNCDSWNYIIAAGLFGLIGSLIQISTVSLGYLKQWKMWCAAHLLIALLSVIAFSIAINKEVHRVRSGIRGDPSGKGVAFATSAGIDFFFSVAAAIGVWSQTL